MNAKYFLSLLMVVSRLSNSFSVVRYCDRIYQLLNRTDESEKNCRFQEALSTPALDIVLNNANECDDIEGNAGLICDEECISFRDWCNPEKGTGRITKCGAFLYHKSVCRNNTFWNGKTCGLRGQRCSGWWPGQCDFSEGCRDGSHENKDWREEYQQYKVRR